MNNNQFNVITRLTSEIGIEHKKFTDEIKKCFDSAKNQIILNSDDPKIDGMEINETLEEIRQLFESEPTMSANKINFTSVNKYFKENDIIISGGAKGRIKIKEIVEHGIRFQSVTSPNYKGLLRYNKLNIVLKNFKTIPEDSISTTVFELLKKNRLFDSTHETNLYGFVKEFIKRIYK